MIEKIVDEYKQGHVKRGSLIEHLLVDVIEQFKIPGKHHEGLAYLMAHGLKKRPPGSKSDKDKKMKLRALSFLLALTGTICAGPLDKPASTPKPKFTPTVKTLDQPDQMRSAADGAGKYEGNPLDRGPITQPKSLTVAVTQNLGDGRLLGISSGRRIMLTDLPDGFLVADGSMLRVKVRPDPQLKQYTTVSGSIATVNSYVVVEATKLGETKQHSRSLESPTLTPAK